MPRPICPTSACVALAAVALTFAGPATAADLAVPPRPLDEAPIAGGGFRVAPVPVRPAPLRYDIYGYPLFARIPNPLAVGNGCPAAIQPVYDPNGNLAGYGPISMCR